MPDKPSTHDLVWFALTAGGVLGALFLWAALDDPWWVAIAGIAVCLPSDDTVVWGA